MNYLKTKPNEEQGRKAEGRDSRRGRVEGGGQENEGRLSFNSREEEEVEEEDDWKSTGRIGAGGGEQNRVEEWEEGREGKRY